MAQEQGKKNRGKMILILLAAVVLVAGGIMVGVNWNRWFPQTQQPAAPTATPAPKLEVDKNAGVYVSPTPKPTSAGIAIPGWGSITMPAGQTEVAVDFPNPEANADKYYLTFELRLKDTGEVLCKTGLVPPGQTIQHITLSRALDAGEYLAVVHVQPYTMDDSQTATNNADMETKLIVVQ